MPMNDCPYTGIPRPCFDCKITGCYMIAQEHSRLLKKASRGEIKYNEILGKIKEKFTHSYEKIKL